VLLLLLLKERLEHQVEVVSAWIGHSVEDQKGLEVANSL
jgi:hypothetical protein